MKLKSTMCVLLALLMLCALFGCTQPADTQQPGIPESAVTVAEGAIEALDAAVELAVAPSADGEPNVDAFFTVTLKDGKAFTASFSNVWQDLENVGGISVTEISDVHVISAVCGIGHGNYEGALMAIFDGEKLTPVNYPFSDIMFPSEAQPMFELSWTDDTTFTLKCNLDGSTNSYQVNEEHYSSVMPHDFSEFDKETSKFEIKELFVGDPDAADGIASDGSLVITARLTYGESTIIFADATIVLKLNTQTAAFDTESVEITIIDNAVQPIA